MYIYDAVPLVTRGGFVAGVAIKVNVQRMSDGRICAFNVQDTGRTNIAYAVWASEEELQKDLQITLVKA